VRGHPDPNLRKFETAEDWRQRYLVSSTRALTAELRALRQMLGGRR
jgi:hypothetical protein